MRNLPPLPLSSRMQAVQTPIIPTVAALIRQAPGTISLGQGVVSYGPPPLALEQLQAFWHDPELHKYQPVQGIPTLQRAIATKLQQENQIQTEDQRGIIVTAGSNMAFLQAILAITSPGDQVILQTPYYFNHEMAIAIADCQAIAVPTDTNYQLQLDRIAAAITPNTRAIVTISPNNPTGAVYPPEALQAVNQLCQQRGLYHISDETYEYFTYGETPHFSPGSLNADHTISLFSLSKAYGFASWRIGYMVIPAALVPALLKIQDTNLICPPVISQYAAVGALTAGRAYCAPKIQAIAQLRSPLLQALQPLAHCCTVPATEGAFYFLLKFQPSGGLSSMAVTEALIREHGVAVIPGSTFGLDPAADGCYLRVAYGALQPETLAEGIGRLVKGLRSLAQA